MLPLETVELDPDFNWILPPSLFNAVPAFNVTLPAITEPESRPFCSSIELLIKAFPVRILKSPLASESVRPVSARTLPEDVSLIPVPTLTAPAA